MSNAKFIYIKTKKPCFSSRRETLEVGDYFYLKINKFTLSGSSNIIFEWLLTNLINQEKMIFVMFNRFTHQLLDFTQNCDLYEKFIQTTFRNGLVLLYLYLL